jgi:hypothetical protein
LANAASSLPTPGNSFQLLYNAGRPSSTNSFEKFVKDAAKHGTISPSPAVLSTASITTMPGPPQKVIGDFERNNEFYAGDGIAYRHGKLEVTPAPDRTLFARTVLQRAPFLRDQTIGWPLAFLSGRLHHRLQMAADLRHNLAERTDSRLPYSIQHHSKELGEYWKVIDSAGTTRSNPYNWEKFGIDTNYQANCAICHTSELRNVKGGGLDADNLVFREPGIGCEMCHGPSASHIAAISTGEVYRKDPLDASVRARTRSSPMRR